MQKRLLHHLLLLLTLISGPGAAAWAAHTPAMAMPSAEASTTESLHLFGHKPFEQVGDVYVNAGLVTPGIPFRGLKPGSIPSGRMAPTTPKPAYLPEVVEGAPRSNWPIHPHNYDPARGDFYNPTNGARKGWPEIAPNRGFAEVYENLPDTTIKKGTIFSRFGTETGKNCSAAGFDLSSRGLPADYVDNQLFIVFLKDVKNVKVGTAAEVPLLHAKGGAPQFVLPDGALNLERAKAVEIWRKKQ